MPASDEVPGHVSGARAVYAVAAELSRLGLIASVTVRNAKGADILVTDVDCHRAFSVQVKSSRARQNWHWLVGKEHPSSRSLVFVFVHFPPEGEPKFYVVPSPTIKRMQRDRDKKMPYVRRADVEAYEDEWDKAFKLKLGGGRGAVAAHRATTGSRAQECGRC